MSRVSIEMEYSANDARRKMDYVLSDDLGTHVRVVQCVNDAGRLAQPTLWIDELANESAAHVLARIAAINDAQKLFTEWSVDVGRRWDGERVIDDSLDSAGDMFAMHSEYTPTISGRRMDYIIGDSVVSVIWVVQSVNPASGLLDSPTLDAEHTTSGAGIGYVKTYADLLDHAISVFERWGADTGKKWNGEHAEIDIPTRLSSRIARLPVLANYSHTAAQEYMRERAELLAEEFERDVADLLFAAEKTDPAVGAIAKAHRDGKPLVECIGDVMRHLATGISQSPTSIKSMGSRLRRHNILDADAIREVMDFLELPEPLVLIVSSDLPRIWSAISTIHKEKPDMERRLNSLFADGALIVRGVDIPPHGDPAKIMGLSAKNLLIMIDEAGEYSADTVAILQSYEQMFSRQRAQTFNAEMDRLGLQVKAS